MNDNDGIQKQVEEYILWCHGECDRLTHEIGQYQNGTLSIGTRKTGEPLTQGTVTHISDLELTIEQLSGVIATHLPPTDQTPISVAEAQIIHFASRKSASNLTRGSLK